MTQRSGYKTVGPMLQGAVAATLTPFVAATLCALMVVAPVMGAEEPGKSAVPVASRTGVLTQQERVLHALNRMTFGPRPGDEAAVRKMGLEKWFELQLHPEQIDDSAFEAEMGKFPAMQMSSAELMKRFPSPQMLRAAENRGGAMPTDPTARAVFADSLADYELRKKKAEAGAPVGADPTMQASGQAAGTPMMADGGAMPGDVAAMGDTAAVAGKKGGKKRAMEAAGGPMEQSDVQAVLQLPPDQRMAKLVAMSPEEMIAFRGALKPYERGQLMQGLSPAQTEMVAAMQGGAVRVVGAEALESRLLRDVDSKRQLQAVMADFWLNHFNVYIRKNQNEAYYLPEYQRDVILPHALGKFEDLLVATAKSPAMLMYLDNWQSIGPDSPAAQRVKKVQAVRPNGKIAQALPKGINENYARELMELHTLGVGGGYTQKDVVEVAKCFTGWTIDRPYQGMGQQQVGFQRPGARGPFGMGGQQPMPEDMATPGEFTFMANRHEPGTKTVLGHTIQEGGEDEGLQVLHILATSPATAKFVSTKLAVRFVSDTPSPALVSAMSATFLKTGGDMAAVLSTMFHSAEFWSPGVYRAKVKTPLEFMVSALRASDATVKNAVPLVQALDRLGMPIYGMQTPNGYSWKADEWVSSNALVSRMNFALVLSGGRVAGTQTNWPALLGEGSVAGAPDAVTEKKLEALLLGEPAAERTRATVLAQSSNTSAVQQATESFAAQPVKGTDSETDGAEMMRATYGKGVRRAGDGAMAGPVTPLDTMAGLLLGSPEFQRR